MVQSHLSTARAHLTALYGKSAGDDAFKRLRALLGRHNLSGTPTERGVNGLSEHDILLITYGDQVSEPGLSPLRTLADLCERHLSGLVNGIHLLPFFPYSSDDGFSVMDYRLVNPALGTWGDISRLGRSFRLMFDAVINHVSVQHAWFQAFLGDDPHYRNYFIVVEGNPDLSRVVRPRALPLLTRFDTPSGPKQVWTTFSRDQVDLNFHNPQVLLDIMDALLFYVARGAQFLRLDAVAYLWKEIGSPCIHLPQTHRIVQLFRTVLDAVAPHVLLITETNVPHRENVSYFGDGGDEAQLVYNFALPPLVLHTFYTGNSRVLSKWAAELKLPSDRTTFLNFLASHDGIGINPARGILSDLEIEALIERAVHHGGRVSYKEEAGGVQGPYELNVNYFDALSDPRTAEPLSAQMDRFMTAQAIMLAWMGVPGIYFHSLLGSRGWPEGVNLTGRSRTINRQKLALTALEGELADRASPRHQVFSRFAQLLRARNASTAFHPHGRQRVLDCGDSIFALMRQSPSGSQSVLCLQNITNQAQTVNLHFEEVSGLASPGRGWFDLIMGQRFNIWRTRSLRLRPYQTLWLAEEGQLPESGSHGTGGLK